MSWILLNPLKRQNVHPFSHVSLILCFSRHLPSYVPFSPSVFLHLCLSSVYLLSVCLSIRLSHCLFLSLSLSFFSLHGKEPTGVQKSHESRRKQWAIPSSVHSFTRSLVCSHPSLNCLLHPAGFASTLRCNHSFACSLTQSLPSSWVSD